jgi:hypothetical protein
VKLFDGNAWSAVVGLVEAVVARQQGKHVCEGNITQQQGERCFMFCIYEKLVAFFLLCIIAVRRRTETRKKFFDRNFHTGNNV